MRSSNPYVCKLLHIEPDRQPLNLRAHLYLQPLRFVVLGLQLELPTYSDGWQFGLSLYLGPLHLEVRRARWVSPY